MKVVPLKHRHTLIQGDEMEDQPVVKKYGNTTVIINPCTDSKEEQERAEHQFHMAIWDIWDELVERGEAG